MTKKAFPLYNLIVPHSSLIKFYFNRQGGFQVVQDGWSYIRTGDSVPLLTHRIVHPHQRLHRDHRRSVYQGKKTIVCFVGKSKTERLFILELCTYIFTNSYSHASTQISDISYLWVNIIVCWTLQVKYDLSLQSNDYEIVDYMMDKFKVATGIGEPKHRPPHRRYKHETQRYDMEGEYIGGEFFY